MGGNFEQEVKFMVHIGRPKKVRYIQKMPAVIQFSPRGRPGRPDQVELTIDQFEALKLADHQGFSQAEGAQAMRVSRPTFGRMLREARKKIANALVAGKVIKIRMGDVQVGVRKIELNREALSKEVAKFAARNKKVARQPGGCGG